MRFLTHTDESGRRYTVKVPKYAPDSHAHMGVRVGPPDLASLELPAEVELRLHNALQARGILSAADVRRRPAEVIASIQQALRLDLQRVLAAYHAAEEDSDAR